MKKSRIIHLVAYVGPRKTVPVCCMGTAAEAQAHANNLEQFKFTLCLNDRRFTNPANSWFEVQEIVLTEEV